VTFLTHYGYDLHTRMLIPHHHCLYLQPSFERFVLQTCFDISHAVVELNRASHFIAANGDHLEVFSATVLTL